MPPGRHSLFIQNHGVFVKSKTRRVLFWQKKGGVAENYGKLYLAVLLGAEPNSSLKARLNQDGSLKPTS